MLIATVVTALTLALPQLPDRIELTNGREIDCRVLFEDSDTVVYTKKRKVEEVPKAEVAAVQSIERSMREFLQRLETVDAGNVTALLELADYCDSQELAGEARSLRIRVLSIDGENETAWTKLGGSHSDRRGWRMKVRGRFYTLEQLRERVADWKNALELPTAHFLLRTDLPPERALDLSVNLERAYEAYYLMLGPVLRLFPFDETPSIHVYASADDYPTPPNSTDVAWFEVRANTLHVDGEQASAAPQAAVESLADVLLWNSLRRTVGKTGSTPGWVRLGFGMAFGGAMQRSEGQANWDLSQPLLHHFRTQASAEKPLSLKDIVRAGLRASDSGSRAELYRAQSYTLAYYLAHGHDGAYREGLGAYLLKAFTGQGAVTHLEKALGVDDKTLQAGWTEFVAEMASR